MLKIAWSPLYAHPLPEGHRFPMIKYELIPEQLLYEGTIGKNNIHAPEPLDESLILLTHDRGYWEKLKHLRLSRQEERRTGFPLSAKLVEREIVIARGTVDCTYLAREYGVALNVAGGTHHAFTDYGEGFCLLNDQAIATNYLLHNNLSERILIIDLDVHQGNGTAQIFSNDPRVFTFSMHGAKNFPGRKEVSDLDIALDDHTGDEAYLKQLQKVLPRVMEEHQPDFVFYLSGVDVLATDKLGRLGMTIEGCRERDRFVLETCHQKKLPVVVCMGGGYSQSITDIVEAHANTYRLARDIWF